MRNNRTADGNESDGVATIYRFCFFYSATYICGGQDFSFSRGLLLHSCFLVNVTPLSI